MPLLEGSFRLIYKDKDQAKKGEAAN